MKRKYVCLALNLMMVQTVLAQRVSFTEEPVKFSINITNAINKGIVVEVNPVTLNPRPPKPRQIKVRLDEENTGITTILLKGPSILKVMNVWPDSSLEYLVIPGAVFRVKLDEKRRDYSDYNTQWKKQNEFYDRIIKKVSSTLQVIPQEDPNVFFEQWKTGIDKYRILTRKSVEEGIGKTYSSWVWQNIQTLFNTELIRYFINYISIAGNWPENTSSFEASCEKLGYLQMDNPDYFTSVDDAKFVSQYFLFLAGIEYYKENHSKPPPQDYLYKSAIEKAKSIKKPGTKKIVIDYLVTSAIKLARDANFLKWITTEIEDQQNKTYYLELIDSKLNDLLRSPVGEPALVFDAVDLKNGPLLYSSFKGKYIYIDVWATWCFPCRREIPFLDELKKKYKEKPIAFLSVSIDKSKLTWKKFVESDSMNESQYLSIPDLKNSISNIYQIRYIPRFLLIGPDGKLLNSDCYRPSDPALKMLFEKLLN